MKILSIIAQKGGQGKSTLCAHLAYAFREAHLKMCVIDFDPQASISDVTFDNVTDDFYQPDCVVNVSQFLTTQLDANILKGKNFLFVKADHANINEKNLNLSAFKSNLDILRENAFDCILIDTQGGLTGITGYALKVASHVVIPFQFGGYDIAAIDKTIELIANIRKQDNRKLRILGMLPCKVETNSKNIMRTLNEARLTTDMIMPLHLANRVAVQEATHNKKPVWKNAKTGAQRAAANEWKNVCLHIIRKMT